MSKVAEFARGERWGYLVAIERAPSRKGRACWRFRCDACGGETVKKGNSVRTGHIRSCGCRVAVSASERVTHGHARIGRWTPEYWSWTSMMQRCDGPDKERFRHWGGRGIKVCERWKDFRSFYADMGPRPSKAHSLDRIDNDGNYEPGNCRWATPAEQSRNRSNAIRLSYGGEQMTLIKASERFAIPVKNIRDRLQKGWSTERALTAPYRALTATGG